MHEDSVAIEAVKRGERDRFGELIGRYQGLVFGIAWSRLGDVSLSEDAVQETFAQGFRFLATLRSPEKFAAWIGRIAHRVVSNMAKRHRRHLAGLRRWQIEQLAAAPAEPPAIAEPGRPMAEMLSDALAELSDAQRESLVLFYLKKKSVREGAEALGISEAAFRTRLHRARASLHERIEARLEPALENLAPHDRLRERVLAALPTAPVGWGGQGLSLSALGGAIKVLGPPLAGPLIVLLMVNWFRCGMARNYREGAEYRRQILWNNFLLLALAVVPLILVTGLVRQAWGPETLFVILGAYMLPAVVGSILLLQVNTSPFVVANTVGSASMSLAFFGMGLGGLSIGWFFAALLVYNVGLWLARGSIPSRADYNLFLRAVRGGLGSVAPGGFQPSPASDAELVAFAQFLGQRFLIADYSLRSAECVCYLPPIQNTLFSSFLLPIARINGSSTVAVAANGVCRTRLSPRDERQLRSLLHDRLLNRSELESQVATVLCESFRLFRAGDAGAAAHLLQIQEDRAVFVKPAHTVFAARFTFTVGVLAAAASLLLFWAFGR